MIVCVVFTGFNINVPFFIYWKLYVVFVQLYCHRWSTKLLDVELVEENDLDGCQRWKLFFVVPGQFMTYFDLLSFVNNKQYGEGEMSLSTFPHSSYRVDFATPLYPLEVF